MFPNLKITPAMNVVFHSVIGLFVGGVAAGLTGAGQAALNTGSNIHVVYAVGIAAFLTSLGHSFFSFKSNPAVPQALNDVASELHIAPALLPDIEALVAQLAPRIASELMKIRAPPVSALQPQQRGQQLQPVQQSPQQNSPYQPPAVNPAMQSGGGGYPQGTMPNRQSQAWDLRTQQVEQVLPYGSGTGRPG